MLWLASKPHNHEPRANTEDLWVSGSNPGGKELGPTNGIVVQGMRTRRRS